MQNISQAIAAVVKDLFHIDVMVEVTRPDEQFGDLATNVAMQIAKQIQQNPRDVAEQLAAQLREKLTETVRDVSIAGPGFINLTVQDTVLIEALPTVAQLGQSLAGKVIVAEYSDPNPFKVLHAGHLYTTLVGDAVSRLLQAAGGKVHRLNYGGDVGLHVGRTMWAIIQSFGGEYPGELDSVPPDERLDWLSGRYVAGTTAYESDQQAKEEIVAINKRVYELHATDDHESDFAKIYWTCRQWSYDGFDRLYEQLQVTPFERYVPESEVTPLGLEIVGQGLEKGVFTKSDGAVVFSGEDQGLHTRVFINSAGLPTYEAKDLGLAAHKWQAYHFDQNIIITANDITEYMKVVLAALQDFYPEAAKRTRHLTHGVIKLPGGVKMSSRKGNILRAADILEAAQQAAENVSDDTTPDTVLAAVKYSFLKVRAGGDVVYNPDESVAVEGNSGPYLQYAHARAKSILGKIQAKPQPITDITEDERRLLSKLTEYGQVFERAVEDLAPHLICTYLYELAQAFNRFYEGNRVIDDPREATRMQIIEQYAAVLKSGLQLLGITAPERV